ncbi:MAG: hypothetical protein ACTSRP_11975 [Candidatus Helarchaeota archaeon]
MEIYNKACFAAIKCKQDRVRSNQINQLLTIFNSNAMNDIEQTLLLLMAFILRQRSRNLFKQDSSKAILRFLKTIFNDNKMDKDEKIKITREYLGLLKWISEAIERIRIDFKIDEENCFDNVIDTYIKSK